MKQPHNVDIHDSLNDCLLTVHEVAKLLHLSPGTIYHFVSEKRIPTIHIGRSVRFSKNALLIWLDTLTESSAAPSTEHQTLPAFPHHKKTQANSTQKGATDESHN